MDDIIMSVVNDQINKFSDNPNLLNVAISRVTKRFCLVVSGNEKGDGWQYKRVGRLYWYISIYSTYLDFLIVNHATKKAVLVIETEDITSTKTEQKSISVI